MKRIDEKINERAHPASYESILATYPNVAIPNIPGIPITKALGDLFGKGMVIPNFEYQSVRMDFAVIVTDRLIEIRWVSSKEEYAKELSSIGRAGRISFDKHKSIKSGKFISNAFYFMAPARILTVDELPPKYGLIVPDKDPGQWKFRKEADWIDPEAYLQKSFYKTLAEKLAKKLYQ